MKEAINPVPAKPKAPLSNPSTECIKLTVQNYRVEINLLKENILQLQKEISLSSVGVSK